MRDASRPTPQLAAQAWSDVRLLCALEEVVDAELNRHLRAAKEWMPHEYAPWGDGRDGGGVMGGDAWEPGQSKVSGIGRTALASSGRRYATSRCSRPPG